jgi:hypothetical protein
VAKALANSRPPGAAPLRRPAAAAAAAGDGFGIDWGDVPERRITLFYPGQSSMEWVQRGSDHGGARAFKAGDRCTVCHDKETADMGRKIVSGEKLEPTPIPGKPGSIPVNVKAAHDGQYLYMQFQWEGSEHVAVPFVEGGKMDPQNPMKLAIMLGSDQPEFAGRAGCWGSCHHDARTMPDVPDPAAAPDGVTKYLARAAPPSNCKGRGGAKLGGWDKRKDEAEINAALAEGKFLDLLRYNAGEGTAEDGYVLADRVMQGGQGVEFRARQEGSQWVVEMRRKLGSDQPGDLSLALDQTYNLGFAIHDDYSDARFHHVSLGYKLGFDNDRGDQRGEARGQGRGRCQPRGGGANRRGGHAGIRRREGFPVDWDKAPSRRVTLFYPGQSSLEWVQRGSDHGGARAFKVGDRCTVCHDKETADMGRKIVSGEKLEPTVIPGKRGSIPVDVQATHDQEHLYALPVGGGQPCPGALRGRGQDGPGQPHEAGRHAGHGRAGIRRRGRLLGHLPPRRQQHAGSPGRRYGAGWGDQVSRREPHRHRTQGARRRQAGGLGQAQGRGGDRHRPGRGQVPRPAPLQGGGGRGRGWLCAGRPGDAGRSGGGVPGPPGGGAMDRGDEAQAEVRPARRHLHRGRQALQPRLRHP